MESVASCARQTVALITADSVDALRHFVTSAFVQSLRALVNVYATDKEPQFDRRVTANSQTIGSRYCDSYNHPPISRMTHCYYLISHSHTGKTYCILTNTNDWTVKTWPIELLLISSHFKRCHSIQRKDVLHTASRFYTVKRRFYTTTPQPQMKQTFR